MLRDFDFEELRKISVREPVKLNGLNFTSLFQWLSDSISFVSRSSTDNTIKSDTPTEWGEIDELLAERIEQLTMIWVGLEQTIEVVDVTT